MRLSLFALLLAVPAAAQPAAEWAPDADAITLAIPEVGWTMAVAVADLDSVTVLNLPTRHEGRRLSGALYGTRDTLRVVPQGAGVHRVRLLGLGREAALDFHFQQAPALRATPAYRARYEGTSRIEVPEVYELVNAVLALTPAGRDSSNTMVWREGPYYERLMARVEPFADHPAVEAMAAVVADDDMVGVRANALAYRFSGDRLVPDTTYLAVSLHKDRLDALVPQLQAFADAVGWRAFYAANAAEYARQVAAMEALLPVRRMWDWLEAEFPARSQSYRTVFSPLTYATHSASTVEDADARYRETVVFLAGPAVLDDAFGSVVGQGTPAWREVEMSRIAFTEFDHTYADPAMLPLSAEVSAALADLDAWNRLPLYRSADATFNEYLTWAVFLLYVDAHYPADTAAEARDGVVRFMEENRGFVRFGAFLDALTVLYDARAEGETLAELLPALVRWSARQ